MNSLKSIVFNLSIPLLISLVFAYIAYNEAGIWSVILKFIPSNGIKIDNIIPKLIPYTFYAISTIVIFVSWHFNRNRFIFIMLPLVLLHLGLESLSQKDIVRLILYSSVLFPIHLLIFLLLKERGLFSIWGILKIVFFISEILLVIYLIIDPNIDLIKMLKIKIFAISFFPLKDLPIAIGIFILFIMSGLIVYNRQLIYNSSFFVITITFYTGLYFYNVPHANDLSLIAIGAIIFTLLIRESYNLAFYDELTLLPGRRALVEDMAKLGRRYSLAMIDIDHFKKFNDTYGHDTGDEVLRMVASALWNVGGGGKAYRYGGEEFVILFPSKNVDEAYLQTDILRENIAKSPFTVRNKQVKKIIYIHISAGVVQRNSKDKGPFAVMKRADTALYKSKKDGRNKVTKA